MSDEPGRTPVVAWPSAVYQDRWYPVTNIMHIGYPGIKTLIISSCPQETEGDALRFAQSVIDNQRDAFAAPPQEADHE